MTNIVLYSEDELIEQATFRLISHSNPRLRVVNRMGKRGFSHFPTRIPEIRRSANALKFLVVLDGDEIGNQCPADAIRGWFGVSRPTNIYVRFACMEVENWLLADRQNVARFFGVSAASLPDVGDDFANAKETLVQIARRSKRRDIVSDMVPQRGHTITVVPAYNLRMSEFIREYWDVDEAAQGNRSLAHACAAIRDI